MPYGYLPRSFNSGPCRAAASFSFHFLERLARVSEGIDSRGNAAIDRDLQQDLLDLVLGQSVLQGALDMQLQFMRPIERAEHCKIDDAAGAPVKSRPGPQCA